MIGLLGRGDDPCLERVRDAADDRGIPHVLIDEDALSDASLRLDLGVDSVRGVPARAPASSTSTCSPGSTRAGARAGRADRRGPRGVRPAPRVARRDRGARHGSTGVDVLQQQQAAPGPAHRCGGARRADDARDQRPGGGARFRSRHGRIIFKSISGIRSIVREVDDAALARMDRIRDLPTQFQAGSRARTCASTSSASPSSRRASPRRRSTTGMPPATGSRLRPRAVGARAGCRAGVHRVASALALPLAGIDLRVGDDGTVTLFRGQPDAGLQLLRVQHRAADRCRRRGLPGPATDRGRAAYDDDESEVA